jgi:hypothetical protein
MESSNTTVLDITDESGSENTAINGRSSAASELSHNTSDSSRDDAASTSGESSNNFIEFNGNRTADSEMITVEIDLTDPDDLARKLDMVDLTDDEADLLLERAQRLNMWLRHQLMKQTSSRRHESVDEYHRHSATCIVSAPAAAASNSDNEDDGSVKVRRSRTFSGSSTLPPLVGGTVGATAAVPYRQNPVAPPYSRRGPSTVHLSQQMSRSPNMVCCSNYVVIQ